MGGGGGSSNNLVNYFNTFELQNINLIRIKTLKFIIAYFC